MKIKNMDINNQNQIINSGSKRKFWKFAMIFCGIIIGILALYIIGNWAWRTYQWRQSEKIGKAAEESIKKWQQEDYAEAMADTYGGKTPQETLQMFIDAVEKGDYELASKYFLGDRQERWKEDLNQIINTNKVDNFLIPIKEALKFTGSFSADENGYAITTPILVDFKKYPNGIWKIIEI